MIHRIREYLGITPKPGNTPEGGGDPEPYDTRLAVCALFLEMATIDGEFSGVEVDRIASIFRNDFNLRDDDFSRLMKESKSELQQSLDHWKFTNLVNENYSREEKIRIAEGLWKVVYADNSVDKHEEYLMRKLTRMLHLSHHDFISAKVKVMKEMRLRARNPGS